MLIELRDLNFSWVEISEILLVSRWTVYRRVREFEIEKRTGYSDISDSELDRIISEIKERHGT